MIVRRHDDGFQITRFPETLDNLRDFGHLLRSFAFFEAFSTGPLSMLSTRA